ncbi:hypothetical protein DPEC_G00036580 [Dallia pectoralis]|uniref:Uncharacterized protein n=1 Tax=Dallia pectoralis TaxID=75939 RepID=A0ACC2HDK2_DALPE|nr:hypothetical protein DPEC_G00036580 [Dallia pectoralis]
MFWSVGFGSGMKVAMLVPSLLILHSFCESVTANQPPRLQNYFFNSYLLIYENTPVGRNDNIQAAAEAPRGWLSQREKEGRWMDGGLDY